jgi:pyruvate/2-oxoglutarate dehydrogenase complex dihydrolipoamide dehydrogenase (E3) component
VVLCEAASKPGGQVNLAQQLPGRAEFGGLVTNLLREAEQAGVEIKYNARIDRPWLDSTNTDVVIMATGASPYLPPVEGEDSAHVVNAWQVLQGEKTGSRVVIADWRTDWVGIGVAELLARQGCHVRLAVNGMGAGQELQSYIRDKWVGTIHGLGVEIIPYTRLFGVDEDSVYLQHTLSNEPVICENVDTLVLALGHRAEISLETELEACGIEYHMVGDCLSPRTAEEAVYEGMMAGLKI